MIRRRTLLTSACAATTLAVPTTWAQSYPSRPIRLLVGFAAGGITDTTARQLAEPLSVALRQTVVVDNKAGAGGNIASAELARATPDGYTLMLASPGQLVVNPLTQSSLGFDPKTPFSLIGLANTSPFVVVVPTTSAFRTIQDLIAYGKQNPGKLNFASPGIGTTMHIGGEMFNAYTDMAALHIPYKGGSQATTDLVAGRINFMVDSLGAVATQLDTNQLRVLAVTTPKRMARFPDLPAMNEIIPDFELSSWLGLIGPPKLPANVMATLTDALKKAVLDPKYVDTVTRRGSHQADSSVAYFEHHLEQERARVQRTVVKSGLKLD